MGQEICTMLISVAKTKIENRSHLAQNIIRRRKAKGWTQSDLAYKAGVHENVIKRIENDKGEGELETRLAVAGALDCTLSDLYQGSPSAQPLPKDHVTLTDLARGDAKILARLEALERRLPNDIEAKKDEKLQEMEAEIERLKALIGPHKALLKRLQDALPIEIEAIYRALKVPREDAQAKKKGEAG